MSKGKSFEALKAEIAQLEVQAAAARRAEIKEVVTSIRASIVKYSLTAADLGFKGAGLSVTRARAGSSRPGAGVAKYRDPKSGKTWTGAGKPPAWIASAKNRDIYLIDQTTVPKAPSAAPSASVKKSGASASKKVAKPAVKPAAKTAVKQSVKPVAKTAVKQTVKPAAKKAVKPDVKPAVKAASKQPVKPPKTASKASAAAPAKAPGTAAAKAAGGGPKIAVRKMDAPKRPLPAQRKAAVGAGKGEPKPEAASAPEGSATSST